MKAVEFIKKFGWIDASHKNVWFYFGCTSEKSFEAIYGFRVVEDLKPYIDAYELVQKHGGLQKLKSTWNDFEANQEYEFYGTNLDLLKQAIALVEEVENFNG